MDITGTGNVSVKWDSFNVAAGETVNFKNMNAILNYVTGRQGSEIFGALNGQGYMFLINPNGILFDKTAQVNVGSLTASPRAYLMSIQLYKILKTALVSVILG
ncbi:MAG: filamentous hemagglutinin N-terminal domain-containing protein [Phascolarctobacterium faecium]